MKMYPLSTSFVAGMVMFNFGGDRSGLDLNWSSASMDIIQFIESQSERVLNQCVVILDRKLFGQIWHPGRSFEFEEGSAYWST